MLLHILFGLAGAAVTGTLLLSGDSQRMTVFVIMAAAGWLVAHLLIWLGGMFSRRSSRSIFADRPAHRRWPASVMLMTVATGLLALMSIVLGAVLLMRSGMQSQLALPALSAAMSGLLFLGLLTRQNWARFVLATVLAGLAAWLSLKAGSAMLEGQPRSAADWLAATMGVFVLLGISGHLLGSRRVRGYFLDPGRF